MLKKQMENLMAGQVVLDTRNNVELEIVGVGETKVILINGKEYSKSTCFNPCYNGICICTGFYL